MIGGFKNRMIRSPFRLYLFLSIFFLVLGLVKIPMAEDLRHFRTWMVEDGLPTSESWYARMNPSGNLWGTYMEHAIKIDGYGVEVIKGPARWLPYFETPGGQLWTFMKEKYNYVGFQQYDYETQTWEEHPIPDLELHQVPRLRYWHLWPYAEDYLVYVHEDALMAYDAKLHVKYELLNVNQANLGKFKELAPSPKGGLWISGTNGLIYVPQPYTDHESYLNWDEYLPPQEFGYEKFTEPVAHENGKVVASAYAKDSEKQVLVELDDGRYHVVLDWGYRLVHGFYDTDGELWAYHIKHEKSDKPRAWIRAKNGEVEIIDSERVLTRGMLSINGMADGTYFVSTKYGHGHYMPPIWKQDTELQTLDEDFTDIHSIIGDEQGRLFCHDRFRFAMRDENGWSLFPFPEGYENHLKQFSHLSVLPNGKILIHIEKRFDKTQLMFFNPEICEFEFFPHPENRYIGRITQKANGWLWVQTFEKPTGRFSYPPSQIEVFQENEFVPHSMKNIENQEPIPFFPQRVTADGTIWASNYRHGIYKYKNDKMQYIESVPKTSKGFNGFLELNNGRIWMICYENIGRSLYEYDGEKFTLLRDQLELVDSMLQRKNGDIWIATETALHCYKNGNWITNNEKDGLPKGYYNRLYEDIHEQLWVATSDGLARYNPSADADPPQTFLDPNKNSTQVAPTIQPQIVFGGIDKWKYTPAHRLYFSFRYDGGEWSSFEERSSATLPVLAHGEHQFEVRAMDRTGNIDPTPARFEFVVLQPWYFENTFLLLMAIISILILLVLTLHLRHHYNLGQEVSVRTRDLQKANQRLRQLSTDIMNVEEKERRQIATDLHDRIGQALSICQIKLESQKAKTNSDEWRSFLSEVTNSIHQTVKDTRSLTFEISPPVLYDVGLEAALEQLVIEMRKKTSMAITFSNDESYKPLSNELRVFLYRSTRELLFNVFKHANANSVHVSLLREEKNLHIHVQDNGQGMDPNPDLWEGYGLFHIRERMHQLGGAIKVYSQSGKGTKVTLIAPINHALESKPE